MQSHITSTFGLVCSRMFMLESHVASFSVNVWWVGVCVCAGILRMPSHLVIRIGLSDAFRQYRQTNFLQSRHMFIDGINQHFSVDCQMTACHIKDGDCLSHPTTVAAQDVDSSCHWCWEWAWPECTMAALPVRINHLHPLEIISRPSDEPTEQAEKTKMLFYWSYLQMVVSKRQAEHMGWWAAKAMIFRSKKDVQKQKTFQHHSRHPTQRVLCDEIQKLI